VPALAEAVRDKRPAVRWAAFSALAAVGQDGLELLLGAVVDPNVVVRRQAPLWLWETGGSENVIVRALASALDDRDLQVRYNAVFVLRELGSDAKLALPALLRALADSNVHVRDLTVRTLWAVEADPEVELPVLANLMRHNDPAVRTSAVRVLYRHGAASAPHYAAALGDANARVRAEAFGYLQYVKGDLREVLPALKPFLESPEAWQRQHAVSLLGKTGATGLPHLIRALDDPVANVRSCAVDALSTLGPVAKKAAPRLIEMVEKGDDLASHAAMAVPCMGPDYLRPLFKAVRQHKDAQVRTWAYYSLVNPTVAANVAVPYLVGGLKDPMAKVRASVAETLGVLGSEARAAVPALQAALSDRYPDVVRAARDALRQIEGK
jgi:HEAT repeat protein